MNTKNTQILIKRVATLVGLSLGAFAVVAVAQVGTWNPPTQTPPNGNVPAPINAGLNSQSKLGQLFINTDLTAPYATGLSVFGKSIFNGQVQILSGTPGANKVLISDAQGNATWGTPSATPPTGSCRSLDSTVSLVPPGENWHDMPVPSECINGMCSVVMKVYATGADPYTANVTTLKIANLTQIQDAYAGATNYWVKPGTAEDGTTCTLGRNGFATGCSAIVGMNSTDIMIYDDSPSGSFSESDPNKWTYKDIYGDSSFASVSVCR